MFSAESVRMTSRRLQW